MKKIIFCTLRDNKGATGGPGGVLYLQKTFLGKKLNSISCEYWFNFFSPKFRFPKIDRIAKFVNYTVFAIRALFNRKAYFFTHDIYSGMILALLKRKYSIVFHQQGPIVQEMINFGQHLSTKEIEKLSKVERIAFTHANSLHFPSNGAAAMYFKNPYASCTQSEVNILPPLYNTIPLETAISNKRTSLIQDSSYITLFSLGTLTEAKGQDLTINMIAKFASKLSKPLRYIMVGKGPLKDKLLASLETIKQSVPSFSYYYYENLPHDEVMYLHKISDIYIMLHRISIFDFATLEAMSQSSAIILSKTGGNIDFQKNDNILFSEDIDTNHDILIKENIDLLKAKNLDVFNQFFSTEAFLNQYKLFFNTILK